VLVFSTSSLSTLGPGSAPQKRWPVAGPIRGLKLSQDGQRLYAALANRIVILDTANGRPIGHVDVPDVETIPHVARG